MELNRGWRESNAGSCPAVQKVQTFPLELKSVHGAKCQSVKCIKTEEEKTEQLLHTCIDVKSPEAQAPRIAAPTKTDSTSLDRTTGLPIQEKAMPLLGGILQHCTSGTIKN